MSVYVNGQEALASPTLLAGSTANFSLQWSSPAATRVLTVPDPLAGANLVLDQGAYTIAGAWTYSSATPIILSNASPVIDASNASANLTIITKRTAANTGISFTLQSYNNVDSATTRFTLTSGVATAAATWASVNHDFGSGTVTGAGVLSVTNATVATSGVAAALVVTGGVAATSEYIAGAATTGIAVQHTASALTSGQMMNLTLSGSSAVVTSASTGSILTLASTTTGFTAATHRLAQIISSGANSNASAIVQGLAISVTNTGTTNTNTALSLAASGGSTANYALNATAGLVKIDDVTAATSPTAGAVIVGGGIATGAASWFTGNLTFNAAATIGTSTGTLTFTSTSTNEIVFSSGNRTHIGGTANAVTAGGTNDLYIFNGVAPVGTIANGYSIYSASGNPVILNSAGHTITVPAPAVTGASVPLTVVDSRSTAQTGAVASVAAYTVGTADATLVVSANVLVTTATDHSFTVTCAYTDEGNTARTLTLSFTLVAGGSLVTSVANANGAVPYMGVVQQIRCKASTTVTIATTGTFTTVTYNVEGLISKVA